jgi:hypothetical protein
MCLINSYEMRSHLHDNIMTKNSRRDEKPSKSNVDDWMVFFCSAKDLATKDPAEKASGRSFTKYDQNPKELMQLLVTDNSNSDSFVSQIWGGRYAKEIQDFRGDNG